MGACLKWYVCIEEGTLAEGFLEEGSACRSRSKCINWSFILIWEKCLTHRNKFAGDEAEKLTVPGGYVYAIICTHVRLTTVS